MRLMRILVAVATLTTFTSALVHEESARSRLRKALFENGDDLLDIRPVSEDGDASVRIKLMLKKIFEMRERQQILVTQLGLDLAWRDRRLAWNASKFGNITHVLVKSDKIWKPDIVLRNSATKNVKDDIVPSTDIIRIQHDGLCFWWPFYGMTESHCSIDTTWYPFDDQRCHLIYGSWQYSAEEINLVTSFNNNSEGGIQLWTDYEPSDEWEVTDKNVLRELREGHIVTFSLHLRRLPLFCVVNHIIPCILLSLIAVVSFILPPSCIKRLGIMMSVLMALSVYQVIISEHLPTSSRNVPVIVTYFVFVLSLCVLSVTLSIFVMYINMSTDTLPVSTIPAWVKWLVCNKLASCLRMRPALNLTPSTVITDLRTDLRRQIEENGVSDVGNIDEQQSSDVKLGNTDKLLTEIRDLLTATFLHAADEGEMRKNDWMLAAAVIDRILFILFSIFFVGGTGVFLALFAFAARA